MLSDDLIKQIFFQSDRPRKDALIADDVDILQFARNVAAVVWIEAQKQEHERCVDFVTEIDLEIGRALKASKP